jgi:hypothetical protein
LPGEVSTPILSAPIVGKKQDGNNIELNIVASDMQTISQIFKDLKSKYPSFDIDKAKRDLIITTRYMSEPLSASMTIGGELAFQSILKTTINFYIWAGGSRNYIVDKIPLLKNKNGINNTMWFSTDNSASYEIAEGEVSHFLSLRGDTSQNILYCLVDFFNCYRFLICLNENYTGPEIQHTYCYSLIENKVLQKTPYLNLTREYVLEHTKPQQPSEDEFKAIEQRIKRTFDVIYKKQQNSEIKNIINKSIQNVRRGNDFSVGIDQQLHNKIINEICKNLAPFYASKLKQGK